MKLKMMMVVLAGLLFAPASASALLKVGVKKVGDDKVKIGKTKNNQLRAKTIAKGKDKIRRGKALEKKGEVQRDHGDTKQIKGKKTGNEALVRKGEKQEARGDKNVRRGQQLQREGQALKTNGRLQQKNKSQTMTRERFDRALETHKANAKAKKARQNEE